MKSISQFLLEALKRVDEGPGSGVDLSIFGTLNYKIEISKGKVILYDWVLSDLSAKVESYEFTYSINNIGKLINFTLFDKKIDYNNSKERFALTNRIDITKYFTKILDLPVTSLVYTNGDLISKLEELNLPDNVSIKELSDKILVEITYDDDCEITDLILNPGGYTTRSLNTKINLFGKYASVGFSQFPYIVVNDDIYNEIESNNNLYDILIENILPNNIYPTKEMCDMYNHIHFDGYKGDEDPDSEEYYPYDIWLSDTEENFDINF